MLSAKIVAQNPGGSLSPASLRAHAGASITTAAFSFDWPELPACAAVHPTRVRTKKLERRIVCMLLKFSKNGFYPC
jgi:hypothetical protein